MSKGFSTREQMPKIIKFIQILKKKEWKDFGHLLRCPTFNKQERLIDFYQILNQKFPIIALPVEVELLPALGLKGHYPKDYVLNKREGNLLAKMKTDFIDLIKRYFILQESKLYPAYEQRLLVSVLMKRKEYDLVPSVIEAQLKKQQKLRVSHRELLNTYLITEPLLYYDLIKNNRSKKVRMQQVIDAFWEYALGNLLRLYSAAAAREKVLSVKYQYPVEMDWLMDLVCKNLEKASPLVQAYYWNIVLLRNTDNEDGFTSLKQLLARKELINWDVLLDSYTHLLNFCSRQILKGNRSYLKQKQDIYMIGLPQKIWHTGMYFPAHHYIALIQNTLEMGDFDEANVFIDRYQADLDPVYQIDLPRLACAFYYFYKKEYERAADHLREVRELEDFYYSLYHKTLYMMLYYECEDQLLNTDKHPLPYAMDALRSFLKRDDKMAERIKQAHHNFRLLIERLFRIKERMAQKKDKAQLLQRLAFDIEETDLLVWGWWLQEKVGKMG